MPIWITCIVLFLALCVVISHLPTFSVLKMRVNDARIRRILDRSEKRAGYALHGLTFLDGRDAPCRIDHIYINEYGVWVIKNCEHKGELFGRKQDKEWVRKEGGERFTVENPVRENAALIVYLSRYLNREGIFHNIVCFINGANVSDVKAENLYRVATMSALKRQKTDIHLTESEMEQLYAELQKFKRSSIVLEEQEEGINEGGVKIVDLSICPICGRGMVLRQGKYGEFYGCGGFPDCRYTRDIDNDRNLKNNQTR